MKLTGAQAVLEILREEGVEYIFGLPGATEVFFMNALEDYPDIKYILGLHEAVVAGMAEGYARTSGKPGILNLHTGTGLGAAMPMLSNAFNGGVPLIITAGQQDTRLQAYEPHLSGDLVKLVSQFTKWGTEIRHVEDIPAIFRRAFRVAVHPPTGPVFISLPQNVMDSTLDFAYFSGAPPFVCSHPDMSSIDIAADLLAQAQNPAIIVQDGIAKSDSLSEVVRLAETIGARVYQPWVGDVNFPGNHPLYGGDLDISSLRTRDLLARVDSLVVIGVPLFSPVFYVSEPLLTSKTKVIHIDDNPWEIGKNFPVSSGIEGDIKIAMSDLISALEKKMTSAGLQAVKARTAMIREEKQRSDKIFAENALKEKDNVPISASRLMQELKDNLKPGARIVDDCWSYSAILRRTFGFHEPKSYQRSRNGGSIGWGLSGALGVKIASPDRQVICVSGDGSAMWTIQSLWTAAHYDIPVTFVICANACYQQVRNTRALLIGEKAIGRNLGTDLCQPQNDFCQIARGMGIKARRVDQPAELKSAFKEAFDLDQPNLVEVRME